MTSAVDTNVLLDVLIPNAAFMAGSQRLLEHASRAGALIICEIVQAELAAHFGQADLLEGQEDLLEGFLADTRIRLERSSARALAVAGQRWRDYRKKAGPLQCPNCGAEVEARCPSCQTPVGCRQHIVADFLVGAHASFHADRLLSRDQGFYRRYFPELVVHAEVP